MTSAHGDASHDDSLSLVDLVACALCSVLLLVFAALASQGGMDGTSAAFCLVSVNWEFDQLPGTLNATAEMNGEPVIVVAGGSVTPLGRFADQPAWKIADSSGLTVQEGESSASNLFFSSPQKKDVRWFWEVRALVRASRRRPDCEMVWVFKGETRPLRVSGRFADQTAGKDQPQVEIKLDLPPTKTPLRVRISATAQTIEREPSHP